MTNDVDMAVDASTTAAIAAPARTPEETGTLEVPAAVQQKYQGATTAALGLLPPAAVAPTATVAAALAAARAHHGACTLVVEGGKLRGYLDMVDLVVADTDGDSEAFVAELVRPFAGTRAAPAKPASFRVLQRETPLAELAVFLQTHPFALITDAARTQVEHVAVAADLARYERASSGPTPLPSRSADESHKDSTLAEVLRMLDGHAPLIPDEVADYYLERAGFQCDDVRLKRMLALATEKFVADIASDSFQYARIRTNAVPGRSRPSGSQAIRDRTRTVLTMDDLASALGEYGIDARRAESFR
ncbi:hypothetical protein MSPP1_003690 [Malassezia sp. CBS 17886]|nr:hypothetical protein MSPP1_003690 [Malassezia sp. CBS 17886]